MNTKTLIAAFVLMMPLVVNAGAKSQLPVISKADGYADNVQKVVIPGAEDYLGTGDTVYVCLPKDFDKSQKYNTVFLCHGLDAHPTTYLKRYRVDTLATKYNEILVLVNSHKDLWYLDSTAPKGPQFKTYFFEKLFKSIMASYPSINTEKTFIDGISMGGHGAMTLFEEHPELFAGGGSMSGVLELIYSTGGKGSIGRALGDWEKGANLLWHKNSAVHNIERLVPYPDKLILISCGTEDTLFPTSQHFMERALMLGVKACCFFTPGAHKYNYWVEALPRHLEIYSRQ